MLGRVLLNVTGVISGYFIFCILSGTETLFVHPEYYGQFAQCALSEGVAFKLSDLKAFFNICFDQGASRPRFYSWFFWVIDAKFRTIFFDFFPFHPTVSLTWIFTFTLLPFYFFKLMRNLNCSTSISIASTFLLLCSQGVLSSLTMYFHSAKPMTLVFLVINLYMASVMHNKCLNQERIDRVFYFKWFFLLLISLFWDELFYVFFLITPWIFRKSIFKKQIIVPFATINLLLFIVFVIANFIVAPHYTEMFFNRGYKFITRVSDVVSVSHLSFETVKYNAMSLIDSHINFTKPLPGYYWRPKGFFYQVVFIFIVLITFLTRKKMNSHIFSVTISFLIFFVFQQILLLGTNGVLFHGSFYQGSPFSVLFSIWTGLLLNSLYDVRFKYFAYVIIAILCLASYRHTIAAVQGHISFSYCSEKIGGKWPEVNLSQKYSYRLIYSIWKKKDDLNKAKKILQGKPCNSSWLLEEVKIYQNVLTSN